MRFAFIAVGCVFFIAPQVGLVDILPDVIGILFILFGISKIADLDVKASESKRRLNVALYISAAKLLCFVGVITRFFDGTMNLTLAFVSGVLECVFLMPAMANLLDSLYDLSPRGAKINIKMLTAAFFILRAVGAVVPDMAGMIFETAGGSVSAGGMTGEQVRIVLIAVFAAAAVIVGAVWLAYSIGAVRAINKDTALLSSLEKRYYDEVTSNKDKMLSRRASRFVNICAAAMFMLIQFRLEGYFITPAFLFGVLVLISLFFAGEFGRVRGMRALLVLFSAAGAAQYVFGIIYSARFAGVFMPYESEGFAASFIPLAASAAAAHVLLAILFVKIGRVLTSFAEASVGLRGGGDDRRRDIDAERRNVICRRIRAFEICGCIYSAASLAAVCMMPFFEWVWIIASALGVGVFVFYFVISRTVKAEAENSL